MSLRYNWQYPKYTEQEITTLKNNYNLPEVASKILLARNITEPQDIKEYLVGEYDEGFNPFLMNDMQVAVDRIYEAIENEEKILVYGDYDADGITSTVLLLETLLSLGANASSYIPNRFTEGYGPNKEAFENIINSGISLIITVDNGIAAVEEVDFANSLGCDVIITDHHKIQDVIPNALAVVHPEHPNANYPFGKLAGVGVAFKLAHALLDIYPDFLLDLVAIGTVADLVPMTSENRIFVKQGLALINDDTRLGLKMLLDIAGHNGAIDETTIGFVIAPRLNAIGRVASAKEGLVFLSTDDINEAQLLAQRVDDYNSERKKITDDIIKEAGQLVAESSERDVLVIAGENFHEGVLGIVASNLVEKYKKPTLVMTKDGEKLKGSARSMFEFNIYEAMNETNHLFTAFGGHSMAAGFSTTEDKLEEIEAELDRLYKEYLASNDDLRVEKTIDLVVNYEDISYQLLSDIDKLKPFGTDFDKPLLLIKDTTILGKIEFGSDKQYLRLIVGSSDDKLECISFRDNDVYKDIKVGDTVDILCYLDKNYFNGRTKLQVHLVDIEVKEYLFTDMRNNIDFNALDVAELKLSKTYQDHKNNYYKYSELALVTEKFDVVSLLDVPTSIKYVEEIVKLQPRKINVICKEKNITFQNYLIDKERLIKLFNILLKVEQLQLTTSSQIDKVVKALTTNIDSLKIMLQILMELDLLTLEKNVATVNKNYTSINLQNSKTYTAMQERFKVEKLLLTESIANINKLFENNEKITE